MARTSTRTEARQRARARMAKATEQRRQREQAELDLITDFETALAHRRQADTDLATAVTRLLELGNSVAAAAELTEQPEAEIRRLRKLATPAARPAPAEPVELAGTVRPATKAARTRRDEQPTLLTWDSDADA